MLVSAVCVMAGNGFRILIVEDHPEIRRLTADCFGEAYFETFEAANGKDALSILAHEQPIHAVILDLQMPVLDGIATAQAIRSDERLKSLRIYGFSGGPSLPGFSAMLFDRFFTKPMLPERLVAAVLADLERGSSPGATSAQP